MPNSQKTDVKSKKVVYTFVSSSTEHTITLFHLLNELYFDLIGTNNNIQYGTYQTFPNP
jgi:hypothetical protein